MKTIRIGYVGGGFVAQKIHMPNIKAIEGAELAAVAEVKPKLGKLVQDAFRIPKLYPDHRALAADPEIDAAAVSGHFAGQGEIAIDLLNLGKDVFMEKPMAVSVEQAERILTAERKSGKRVMVAYMKRYDGGNVTIKEMVDGFRKSGELGEIRYVRNHGFCGDWTGGLGYEHIKTDEPNPKAPSGKPGWMPEKFCNSYIGYLQQYTHNVNLIRWFLDAGDKTKVKFVDLTGGYAGVAVLDVNGVRAVVESGNVAHHAWDEHTQIYFDKGWIRSEAPPLLLRNAPATVEVYRGDRRHEKRQVFPPSGWTWSYTEEMRHFVDCIRTGAPFRSPAADAACDVRLLEEIYRRHVESPGA